MKLKDGRTALERRKTMNIRKPIDYSILFSEIDKLVAEQLPQMELYCEIG